MAQVKFIATTLTSRGRFVKGDVSNLFTDDEAKDLQRLSSVESPNVSTMKKSKPVKKTDKKKVETDESKDISK